jgi:integrase
MASMWKKGKIFYIQTCKDGVKKQWSLRTSNPKIAAFRKNEIENQLAQGNSPLVERIVTANQCFEDFKRSREGVLEPKTVAVVNQRIKAFLDDFRINRIASITEEAVKTHLDRRIEKDGISPKTANHSIVQIGTFLTYCVRKKHIKENPLRWMKRYRMDPVIPRFLAHGEAQALLLLAKPTKIANIISIALYTGMRWGEIARLQWEDFDIEKNEVTVRKSKTNKYRTIPIADKLKAFISKGKKGNCTELSYDQMEDIFTDIREGLKIDGSPVPHFRFHDLRHTFASMAIKSGADLLTLSKWLGHSTIRTTELYAHLYDDHSQAAMKKFCL